MTPKKLIAGAIALIFAFSVFISLVSFPVQIVEAGDNPTTTYGDGWKEIRYSDGRVTHTDGIRTFQRWDGEWRPWSEWDSTYTNISGNLIADGGNFKSVFYQHKNTIITDKFSFSQQPSALYFLNIDTKAYTKILDASATSQITMQGNKLAYEDVYPNVDYGFTYDGVKLKEDIVSHRTNYPDSPYPLDKTYLVFSTKLWEFSKIHKLMDDDGEIGGNKDVKGVLKLKDVNGDVLSYLPIGDATSLFVNQICYNETNEEPYICNQTKTTKVHNRLIKVSGTWYLFSGIKYSWVKDVNRTGDITIDPTWVVGSGGNAWSGNVSYDNTLEVQCTGKVELRQEVDDYVSCWRMDKGTGNTAYDQNETSNNDGSFTNGSTGNWTSSSKYGDYALNFDGTDDCVDLNSHVSNFASLSEGTIELWFYSTDVTGGHALFSSSDKSDASSDFSIRSWGSLLEIDIREAGSMFLYAHIPFSVSQWYHFVFTVDSSGNKWYLNGVLQSPTYDTGDVSTQAFFNTVNDLDILRFGIREDSSGFEYPYNGLLDEVRIYNRALSNAEINQTRDNEHYISGNLTSWHDAGSGNETYKLSANFTFPTNTNASVNLYNNDTGAFIENLASHTTTTTWDATITSAVQDSRINITLFGNVSQTPEIINITYHTQESSAGVPNITSWSNNYTNDNTADFSCIWGSNINFNATANQTITTWNWYANNTNQNHNFDNFSYYFDTIQLKEIIVNATNTNGTSNSVQWNVSSNIAPEIKEVITIT